LFSKIITNIYGENFTLLHNFKKEKSDASYSDKYVSFGIVQCFNSDNFPMKVGDICFIDYTVDNQDEIILGYEGEDKLVAVRCKTKYYEETKRVTGKLGNDVYAWFEGEIEETTGIIGGVSDKKLQTIAPYVILNYEDSEVQRNYSGIFVVEKDPIVTREVLATSESSKVKFGFEQGNNVLVQANSLFNIRYSGGHFSAIMDEDIIAAETN
jgi:hypothetical protein